MMSPCVASRLWRMRPASTCRPSIIWTVCSSAPAPSMQISGSVSHSACQPPSPRSCSCTIAASMTDTSPGTLVAAASTTAHATGLRLCGIVEEPPRPGAAGSKASPISVCIISDTSCAIFPSVPTSKPSVVATSATRSRCACQESPGSPSFSSAASALPTAGPRWPSEANVPAAPPNWMTSTRACNS